MYCGILRPLGVEVKDSLQFIPWRRAFDPHEPAPRHCIAAHFDDSAFGPSVLKAKLLVDRLEAAAWFNRSSIARHLDPNKRGPWLGGKPGVLEPSDHRLGDRKDRSIKKMHARKKRSNTC